MKAKRDVTDTFGSGIQKVESRRDSFNDRESLGSAINAKPKSKTSSLAGMFGKKGNSNSKGSGS